MHLERQYGSGLVEYEILVYARPVSRVAVVALRELFEGGILLYVLLRQIEGGLVDLGARARAGGELVSDEYVGEMKKQFSLPPFPILHFTNLVNKLCFGWSFTEASSLDAVSRTKVPMLFIHGDNDTYVPTDMVYRLYDAHKGRKSLWLSPGSMHARSYDDHPADYTHKVREFIELE